MDNAPQRTHVDVGTETALTIGQAALGFGVGLLVSKKLSEKIRIRTGVSLLSLGVMTALPFAANWIVKTVNRPDSRRSVARRLRSIREGVSGDTLFEE